MNTPDDYGTRQRIPKCRVQQSTCIHSGAKHLVNEMVLVMEHWNSRKQLDDLQSAGDTSNQMI